MTVAYSDTMTDLSTGDVVTAADMDLIRNNIESIHDQIVVFEEALTAADFSTSSTSYVEVTGCSVSVTTPVAMRVAIAVSGIAWSSGAANSAKLNVQVDGTEIDSHADGIQKSYNTSPKPAGFVRWHSLVAGTYTIRLVIKADAGTAYINNATIQVIGFMET